jgi:hypothetical protein
MARLAHMDATPLHAARRDSNPGSPNFKSNAVTTRPTRPTVYAVDRSIYGRQNIGGWSPLGKSEYTRQANLVNVVDISINIINGINRDEQSLIRICSIIAKSMCLPSK